MNADETAAALAYANGIDGRVTITPARHDLWAIKLAHLPAGARATVQLLPDNTLTGLLARGQIRLLSLLHYIY